MLSYRVNLKRFVKACFYETNKNQISSIHWKSFFYTAGMIFLGYMRWTSLIDLWNLWMIILIFFISFLWLAVDVESSWLLLSFTVVVFEMRSNVTIISFVPIWSLWKLFCFHNKKEEVWRHQTSKSTDTFHLKSSVFWMITLFNDCSFISSVWWFSINLSANITRFEQKSNEKEIQINSFFSSKIQLFKTNIVCVIKSGA